MSTEFWHQIGQHCRRASSRIVSQTWHTHRPGITITMHDGTSCIKASWFPSRNISHELPVHHSVSGDGGVWRGRLLPPLRQSTSLHLRELQAAIDDYRALSPAARHITGQRNNSHLRHKRHKAIAPLPHSHNPTWLTTLPPLSWTSQYSTTCQSA